VGLLQLQPRQGISTNIDLHSYSGADIKKPERDDPKRRQRSLRQQDVAKRSAVRRPMCWHDETVESLIKVSENLAVDPRIILHK